MSAVRTSYGSHPDQFVELTLPTGTGAAPGGPVPVVVVLHGGFWRAAYGVELARPLAADLADAGFVRATPPAQPGQPAPAPVRRPARFVGVDGPRWFLRGMISGSAAESSEAAAALEQAFRQIVVVRGTAPMPVREPLPLTLPPQAAAQLAAQQAVRPPGTPPPAPPGA